MANGQNRRDLMHAGEDIMDSVNRALETGDFSRLSSDINHTVMDVTKTMAGRAMTNMPGMNPPPQRPADRPPHYSHNVSGNYQRGKSGSGRNIFGNPDFSEEVNRVFGTGRTRSNPFLMNRVSRSRGRGKLIAGWILIVFFGLATAVSLIPPVDAGAIVLCGAITAGSVFLARSGRKDGELVNRYYQYGHLIGERTYITIGELARMSGRSREQVLKDLKAMIKSGMLPQARFDQKKTTLMLTQEVYDQYMSAETEREARERAAREEKEREAALTPAERRYQQILRDGQGYIDAIRSANDAIPDDKMSAKLDRLEKIVKKIFDQVKAHPNSADDVGKLLDYYLPTTQKLLDAYIALDKQPDHLENVQSTKRQIEDAMDTINSAFEKLLNEMFQDIAWDVNSDISVMETMMKQDGIAGMNIHDQVVEPDQNKKAEEQTAESSEGHVLTFGNKG